MKKIKSKKLKKSLIVLIILLIIYIILRFMFKFIIGVNKVCYAKGGFYNKCFIVEVAKTDKERQKGLMDRENLKKNRGMIFVFEEEKNYSFWMKDTLISLDIIRIDSQGKIVDIQTANPCDATLCPNYVPQGNAKYVLEINAGIAEKKGIKIGDTLTFKLK
ncbi:MAG TPA: DUF192 domain-containing protein [Candidatus Absconditabacterales bacterium]|nr:DUF192 domain-containing protein [Candidatus Absconditabacterales bacterium]HOQ79379.1 DUF192 domain-containing protein [Candidatus Absconditabacterales bacterium]HPK27864.1 DUF192 domain-containing protein [Candidatus Absconditabacterales bacterium]